MKAFILAAGNGERLRPLTDAAPKCLMPVKGVPILGIWLELCRRHGIDEVLINTHAKAELVKKYLSTQRTMPRVQTRYESELLGSAGTLLLNKEWIGSEPEFWVFYGDVLTNLDLKRMLEFHRSQKATATLGVYAVPNPQQCGIVEMDANQRISRFVEKPLHPAGNLAFAGVLVATPDIFMEIPNQLPADLGFHVFPKLIGSMVAYPISEYLIDIGTLESYRRAQETWPGIDANSFRGSSHELAEIA